jgi:membrane protease subunit HflK
MPWNNQSGGSGGGGGGGWKGGGGGPWGQGPSGGGGGGGGGNQPPDLEEFLKRGQDRLKQVMPGSGLPGPLILLLAALATAVLGFYAFTFQVKPDEQGVVLRFGQYVRWAEPGLHFRWPPPIEEIYLPKVLQQRITEVGVRNVGRAGTSSLRDHPEESLMLTGDENIVDVNFTVYWKIRTDRDPKTNRWGVEQYLFNIEDPQNTVKEVAESVMREVIGQSDLQPILTEARLKIEQQVQKLIQEVVDSYGSGIRVDQVQLQKVDPPAEVIESFRNVQAARQDRDRLQNEAQTYANQKVPEARGAAERILQEAEGYKQQTVAEAVGQSSRFLQVYEEYKKAPDVTRKRLFLETMERVLGGADKIIIDNKGGQGVVPFLPLDQLQKK